MLLVCDWWYWGTEWILYGELVMQTANGGPGVVIVCQESRQKFL